MNSNTKVYESINFLSKGKALNINRIMLYCNVNHFKPNIKLKDKIIKLTITTIISQWIDKIKGSKF